MNESIAVINSVEFINLQPLEISPLMSACEIKVLYIGENRNQTYITKEVATEMSKTLRGCPIVGHYKQDVEDFGDHARQIIIENGTVSFQCLTKPYGFVSPDAQVWFQKFEEPDGNGATIIREYLVTQGYIWTGQFEEAQKIIDEGRPHSMELDQETLDGYWTDKINPSIEFFIINDAMFSKLCVLGEDVEPCFEGSSVTAPASYSLDTNFKRTLFSMMQDLEKVIKGGQTMEPEVIDTVVVEEPVEETQTEAPAVETPEVPSEETEPVVKTPITEPEIEPAVVVEEPVAEPVVEEEPIEETPVVAEEIEAEPAQVEDFQAKYEALVEEHSQLQTSHSELESQLSELRTKYDELVEFKNKIDNKEKDELIDSFTMLTDEEKAEVIDNKANYSLAEIEEKLSVLYVRKTVNLKDTNSEDVTNHPVVTFNVADNGANVPAWVAAIKNTKNNRN